MTLTDLALSCGIITLNVVCIVGLIGWFRLESYKQAQITYRAELKAKSEGVDTSGEGDMMQQMIMLALKNPELIKQVLGGLNKGGNS